MKKNYLLLLTVAVSSLVTAAEKNNHITFTLTNQTNLNFCVITSGINEDPQNHPQPDGKLQPGNIYRYRHSFSREELLKYTAFHFISENVGPWKKWFTVCHSNGQSIVVDILLAYFNSKQRFQMEAHNLKAHEHTTTVRQDPSTTPFNIAIHLILKRGRFSTDDFLPSAGPMGFRKIDLEDSTIEITEIK